MQRVVLPGGAVTWTVLDEHARVAGPAEEFLEFFEGAGEFAEHGEPCVP